VGSELEKMLPVSFVPPTTSPDQNRLAAHAAAFVRQMKMRRYQGGSLNGDELLPDATVPPTLKPFVWEDNSRAREIFSEAQKAGRELGTPLFVEYAHVAAAKPGAEVFARHPTDLIPGTTQRAILMALQRYGRGQSGVLTSDALWRWKINQPSNGRGVELFWQNLFAWLARERQTDLRFEHAPLHAEMGREITLRVAGAGGDGLKVEATQGPRSDGFVEGAADNGIRLFSWTPPAEGAWQIRATDASGREALHSLSVKKIGPAGELDGKPPADTVMRALAERTGGAMLENGPPAAWVAVTPKKSELRSKHQEELWHRPWIFALLIGCYGTELILRRKWKLL
jgi:hypothetical protein